MQEFTRHKRRTYPRTQHRPLCADYSADNAEKALTLLDDILRTCVDGPKSAARAWVEGPGRSELEELRN